MAAFRAYPIEHCLQVFEQSNASRFDRTCGSYGCGLGFLDLDSSHLLLQMTWSTFVEKQLGDRLIFWLSSL